jgi:cytochrome bd-type quinol oxidase subunit 2
MAEDVSKGAMDWFRKQAEKEIKKDLLKRPDRVGQAIGLVGCLIVIIFFGYHLSKPTGFFTSAFGTFGAVLFFGINIIGIIPQAVRLVKGRKNPARPFDILNSALFLVALIYFVATFPFDFSHFADPLPTSLEFLINWISNGLASALMVIGILGLLFALPYQILLFKAIRELPPEVKEQPPVETQSSVAEKAPEAPK